MCNHFGKCFFVIKYSLFTLGYFMGTHACTRIQSKDDYIEMHTRWDGFPTEIKQTLKTLNQEWLATAKFVLERVALLDDTHPLKYLEKWAKNLRNYTNQPNTIEKISTLLCARCFVHHHVIPHATASSQETIGYWGAGSPDVIALLDDAGKMTFSLKKKLECVNGRKLGDEWNIIRIEDEEEDEPRYIYLKTKLTDVRQLYEMLYQLPFFWRDFHTLNRVQVYNMDYKAEYPYPIKTYSRKIAEFYNPPEGYGLSYKKARSLAEKIEDTESMIPFDMWINTFATHLMMQNPGVFEPLTAAEDQFDYEPLASFKLANNRLTNVSLKTHLSKKEVTEIIEQEEQKHLAHEQAFMHTYGLSQAITPQFNKKFPTISYEMALIKLLEGVEEMDMLSKLKKHKP